MLKIIILFFCISSCFSAPLPTAGIGPETTFTRRQKTNVTAQGWVTALSNVTYFGHNTNKGHFTIGSVGDEHEIKIASKTNAFWRHRPVSFVNEGERDDTYQIGFNLDREMPTRPRWFMEFENNWKINDTLWTEWYLQQDKATGGQGIRPLMVQLRQEDGQYGSIWSSRGAWNFRPSGYVGDDKISVLYIGDTSTNSGFVGINTESPTVTLDVKGDNPTIRIEATNGSASFVAAALGKTGVLLQSEAGSGAGYLYNRDSAPWYFGTANTLRMTLDSAGQLGLGVAPTAKLDVSGPPNSPVLVINTNTLVVRSNFVGIGTDTPQVALDIRGDVMQLASFTNGATLQVTASNRLGLSFQSERESGAGYVYLRDSAPLYFGTSNTLRMTLDSIGRLGIGTNTPQFPLHVVGDANVDGAYTSVRSAAGNNSLLSQVSGDAFSRFAITADGGHYWGSGSAALDSTLYRSAVSTLRTDGNLIVKTNLDIFERLRFGAGNSANLYHDGSFYLDNFSGPMLLFNRGSDTIFYNASVEKMRLTSTGLGIGTNIPASALHIHGGGPLIVQNVTGTTNDLLQLRDTNNTPLVTVSSNGYVGIGISPNTTQRLLVNGTIRATSGNSIYLFPSISASGEIVAGTSLQADNNLSLYLNTGVAGKSVAAYYFDGAQYRSALEFTNTASGFSGLALMKSGGNVGIGTATATNRLDVNGHTSLRSNLWAFNLGTNGTVVSLLGRDANSKIVETAIPSGGAGGIATNAGTGFNNTFTNATHVGVTKFDGSDQYYASNGVFAIDASLGIQISKAGSAMYVGNNAASIFLDVGNDVQGTMASYGVGPYGARFDLNSSTAGIGSTIASHTTADGYLAVREGLTMTPGVIDSGGYVMSVFETNNSFTVTSNICAVIVDTTSGGVLITLPATAGVFDGQWFRVKNIGVNTVTITNGNGSDKIDGALSATLTAQYQSVDLVRKGTNYWKF